MTNPGFALSDSMKAPGRVTLLKADFFNRDPRRVARALLGKLLVRKTPRGILAGRIVETEAYLGKGDAAAHAAAGRTRAEFRSLRSSRSRLRLLHLWQSLLPECFLPARRSSRLRARFAPWSRWPASSKWQKHEGSSSCGDGRPRKPALSEAEGSKPSAARQYPRRTPQFRIHDTARTGSQEISLLKKISSGPGRLTEALQITRERDNGKSLVSARSDLQIVDDAYRVRRIIVTTRVGIAKSAEQPLRYFIAGNPFVSGREL